jgi:hypothetical protein
MADLPPHIAQTIAFEVTDLDKCAGAAVICTHSDGHPCRACHITAFGVLVGVSQYRARVHGTPTP